MKKVRYSFISFLLVVVCATINAQMYTRTAARTYGTPALGENGLSQDPFTQRGALKIGGTSGFWYGPTGLQVESRGVELYNDTWGIDDYPKNPATASRPDPNSLGFWWWNYMDISDKTSDIEIVSGQEFTVKSPVNYYWTNAVAFVDWDGNGSFDDHDPLLYDKYGQVTYALIEYSGATITSSFLADWTFIAPNVSEERKVRIRIRADIGVAEDCFMKRRAINGFNGNELGIPKCNYVQEKITNDKNNQNFMPMNLHRFFPTAEGRKGGTLDFTVTIKPDPYSTTTPQPKETIVGAGNVAAACQTTTGTAISDAAGFLAFMSATSGDYYLANDITLTSVPVSQTTFSGTFDGNGHTITFSSAATATISGKAKDECFYPYGNSDTQISQNLFIEKQPGGKYPAVDMTNYPERAIAGGFCGVLARGGVLKNVKVVYNANATYNNTSGVAPIFGLVAGINKGHIENVSIDIPAGKTVKLQNSGNPTASAFGGITGLLFRGVVKHCAVNIDGTMSHDAANAMQETLTSAFIGRLQVGIVSNVKFSGSGTMYANSSSVNYVRNYMGGIAGMTNTPKGEFCGDEDFNRQLKSWGYDNGTRGLDVNNVILSYTGAMNMANAGNNGSYAYNCRGLLFAEAYDTIVVPNLVTQYAALPTIEMEAPTTASLSGANIPLISNTKGIYSAMVAFCTGVQDENNTPRLLGKVYLYKDARFSDDSAKGDKFTNVNVADTEVDWAYEYDPNTCSYYSTPYAVATYTGTNANVQGIESASANVSDLGNTMVKIDPQPADVASPSWTWSETATPPAAEPIETPICGGGTTTLPLLTYCTPGNQGDSGQAGQRSITSFTINGTTIAVNETSANYSPAYRGYKNSEANAIEVTPGQTFTISSIHQDNWIHINAFVDWNHDGVFERIGRSPNDNLGGAASFTVTVPNDAAIAYTPLRLMLAWLDVNDACTFSSPDNPCIAVDIVLKVIESAYCAQPTFASHTTGTTATGYLKNLTANGEALATNWDSNQSQNTVGKTITINPGGNLNLNFTFQCDWSNNNVDDKGLNWTTAFAFVDLNGDGDFTDSGERIYARGGGGCDQANDAILPDGRTGSDATWTGTKTVKLTATSKSMLRIYTIGEYNNGFVQSTNGSKAAFDTGCATGGFNGDSGSNKFHCYDFPIVINSAASGNGCAYVHDFGSVAAGSDVTYEMNLGAVVAIVKDSTLAAPFTATASGEKLIINYSPEAVGSHEAGFRISLDGGEQFPVSLTGTGVRYPNVTFRQGENGGGALSLDMGKTYTINEIELAPYQGELLTAVPFGPTHIVGWYYSTDGGTTWTDVGHANPDYTYTGADDAIVEVRFDFDDFEGNFGNSRFTDNSNVPFYISAISTTNGIVNVNATNVFIEDSVAGGKARWRYMENQRLQTLKPVLKEMTHHVTVTVQNANKIPADARLMCFVDYNMNNYFDFASSPDGLASALSANGELVFVADPNDTDSEQTFEFDISNAGIDKFGKTRMRFMVATYVDMFGLGPVNQYGNYQPRFDTDGDGIADTNLPLNDNNGSLYTPNNQCRLENYVNVADVTFEVVAFVRYNDKYVIKNGESVRMKNLYIEAMEDATGFHAGQIVFDKTAPYGSLIVEGNIIIRRRIYPNKWHDLSFPIAMQGVGGKDGVCAVGENGALGKLPATGKHLLYEFDPAGRNQTGGYNGGTNASSDATFQANKFYEFAADVPDGFTANNAGDGIDSENSYWIQFHSVDTGFVIAPSAAKTATLSYTRDEDAPEYWNRNVFTLYNPFLSNINVKEITTSVGWENITWWNAVQNRYTGVSAAQPLDMPPYFGYWIQFTEGIGSGAPISIVLGNASRDDYPYANSDDRVVNFALRIAAQAPTFDTPDSYTLGIDAAENASNETAVSSTIVTLTDEGSIDNFRAGYDMPASFAAADAEVPEIWTKAGESNMMFNDVRRADEVVVPVGIRIKEAGEYAVRLTHTNDTTSLVQLRDKETGAIVDLQSDGEESSYLFLADEGDANRFELVISKAPQMVTDLEFVETLQGEGEAQVYVIGDNLCLKNIAMGYSVSVCDVLGREYLRTLVTEADMKVLLPAMRGVYIVNILDKQNISVQSVKVTK